MRRIWIVLSIVVAVVVILVIAFAMTLNVNKYRPRVQAELQNKLGRPVTLGELHLHLFPFSLGVDSLSIAESPAFPSTLPFVTAKEVYVSAGLLSLIRGEPQVNDITLNDPQIELIRNAAGAWNYSDIGGGSTGNNRANKSSGGGTDLTLNHLKIVNGQVAITDQHAKSPRTVYNHIDVTMAGFAPGKRFNLDAEIHLPGPGKELLVFRGNAGPLAAGNTESTPVNGDISFEEVSLAGFNSVAAGTIPANTDASISGKANVASSNGNVGCKGNLTLTNVVVRGSKSSYPIDTQYDLSLTPSTDQIRISSASVKMGPTAVAISGAANSGVTPATFNAKVQTNNASITDLARLAGLFGVAFDPNDQVKGSITADLTADGTAKAPQVHGTISSNSIQAQDIALSNVHATVTTKDGVIDVSPFTATVFGGQGNGTATLDTKAAHPLCSVKAKLSGVDTNALLSAVSSLKDTLYGSLAADANLNFTLGSGGDLARTLNGVLTFGVTNGQLKHVNILAELSRVGKFLNNAPAQSGSGTTLQKFAGTLNITNGVANTNNLVATMTEGSLSANGSLNLVTEAIDMHMNAVLANTTSKAVGGTSVGGFLNTALSNNQGELVLPVLVTGSMAHPVFAPDVQAIAKMKLSHLLPTSNNPSALANGLLGSVLGGATGQQQQNQKGKQQQQNPLDILKGLTKH
jgi:AsmA protein